MEMQDSVRTTTVWQSENEILEPVVVQVEEKEEGRTVRQTAPQHVAATPRVRVRHEVPRLLAYPYVEETVTTDSVAVSGATAPTDSIAPDTVRVVAGEQRGGIVLVNPVSNFTMTDKPSDHRPTWGGGMSWIYLALAALFCAIGVKFKGNSKYMKALYTDLVDTRLRSNVFDDTVKETSLLVLLNVGWVACVGILTWFLVRMTGPGMVSDSFTLPNLPAKGILICVCVIALYMGVQMLAYWIVGNVFSDSRETRLWIKGAAAANGLETFLLFPCALLALAYPAWNSTTLLVAGGVILIGKIVFLYKGFRIFFNQISSWLLFLYYLCSLEIVPLIVTYFAAVAACTYWM